MCVPCPPGCERCDGYPSKEYTELISTYGKDLADEVMQGYTYLGMLTSGPFMTYQFFEPECRQCADGTGWDALESRCTDTCSGGY